VLILGCVTALERVGAFLLDVTDRLAQGEWTTLPITRYDIADCLALSAETVSRAIGELRKRRLIEMGPARTFRIRDRATLEDGAS
jgi:CRP-like cAMP-binding protein